MSGIRARPPRAAITAVALAGALVLPAQADAQGGRGAAAARGPLPSIADKTAGMRRIDGFFPLYWDESAGQLWLEIGRFDTEVLHVSGLAAGLGSNDIGLDRGTLSGSEIVKFQRVGPKILLVQPNYRFRAVTQDAAERKAVEDAFARSVLYGFTAAAETDGRVLVDATEWLIRDEDNIGQRMRPGTYRLDASRSAIYTPMTQGFPKNVEMEAELTFVQQPGGGGGGRGGGGGSFEGVGNVAATSSAATLRVHHSLVELPDDGYEPRAYDPRAGYGGLSYEDYATPITEPMTRRFIRRHRLEKKDPSARISDPVKPIIYYLDPGTPEPIRSALMEGAGWWNQAFEGAGYRNAFQVKLLPDGASPLDIRYNVINWVHRSTRGWSTGASVTDPRTGEIIKGVVTLGSLRVRQDYLIAEALLSPYATGDETPPELARWALARVRQLAAHEVGHTLGLSHNYYDSEAGRISVMDYPQPLVKLAANNTFDTSDVYDVGIAEWDTVAITYGYQDFPAGVNERAALDKLLDDAWARDIRFMTNQDTEANPRVDQWSNGTDQPAELDRMMQIRRVALGRFGENAIRRRAPLATMEEALVPLYLYHRYQVEATASAVGGINYIYALRGDGRTPVAPVSGAEQRAALKSLMATLDPAALALPQPVLTRLPPRPSGWGYHRELFPRNTGLMFDVISPAAVAADLTVGFLLDDARAARLVEQRAVDPSLPGLGEVVDQLFAASFGAATRNSYQAEISRAVERVVIDRLASLATSAPMPQVRAIAMAKLESRRTEMQRTMASADEADAAHFALLSHDIERTMAMPAAPYSPPTLADAPPGAPIGEPAMDWLRRMEPPCSAWYDDGMW